MDTPEPKEKTTTETLKLFPYAGFIIAGFLLIGVVSYIFQLCKNEPRAAENTVVQNRLKNLADVRTGEQKLAHSYGWIDKNAGIVHIPVEQAMELTLPELRQKPVSKTEIKVEVPSAVK